MELQLEVQNSQALQEIDLDKEVVEYFAPSEYLTDVVIGDIGQMESMDLEGNWIENEPHTSDGTTFFKQYHAADNPVSSICFYFRGAPLSPDSRDKFDKLLMKPDHMLLPLEFKELEQVLRNKGKVNGFALQFAETRTINGKRVLEVEGRFKDQNYSTVALYVDADGNGSSVQEIYYQGPESDITSLRRAKEAFRTIEWKSSI